MEEKMKNINEITKEEAQKIEYILTDIDGTLTNDGPMLPEAYEALWKLHNAGFKIIPVTGRTAGWASVNILRTVPGKALFIRLFPEISPRSTKKFSPQCAKNIRT